MGNFNPNAQPAPAPTSLPMPGGSGDGSGQPSQAYQDQMNMLQKQMQTAQAQAAAAQAQLNAGPQRPDFKGLTGEDGQLLDKYKLSDGSQYGQIATNALNQQTAQGMNNAAQSNMGAQAQARTALATRGGLGGGAALRLAQSGQQNLANARQDVGSAAAQGAQGIQQKQYDIGREAEKANVGNLIKNQAGLNEFDLKKYGDQMQAWAADKSANAQAAAANSGKK